MQYRNRIIALFLTVCLLVTSLCVPVGATNSGTMLYNGVELPNIDTVWTDKVTYPYAVINIEHFADGHQEYFLTLTKTEPFYDGSLVFEGTSALVYFLSRSNSPAWEFTEEADDSYILNEPFVWANYDLLYDDGTLCISASDPVDSNSPVVPDVPESPATNATISIGTLHPGDTYASSVVFVEGLESTAPIYSIRASFSSGDAVVASSESDMFAGPGTFWHFTKNNLSPKTDYTLTYTLLENGAETSVTASQSFTTYASNDTPTVDDTQTLSLLSAILAAIIDQNDRQENEYKSIVDILGMLWLRLRYIEENTAALVSSKEETALKEAVKETTQAVTDSLYADDAPTKVTISDVKDVAQIGAAASNIFDFGVGVGSLFDVLNDLSFLSVFTQEMVDSMNTATTPFIISNSDFDSAEYYYKNYEEVKEFMTGG